MVCGIGEISASDQPCGGAKERGEATSVGSIAHMQPEDRLKMGKKKEVSPGILARGGPNHRNEREGI